MKMRKGFIQYKFNDGEILTLPVDDKMKGIPCGITFGKGEKLTPVYPDYQPYTVQYCHAENMWFRAQIELDKLAITARLPKKGSKAELWQSLADELWAVNPKLPKCAIGRILVGRGYGTSVQNIRKTIKKNN